MEDFLEKAKREGRIKPASDAFREYPVDEEIHKGQVDYFLEEETETYSEYSVGDIVFVKNYKYENGATGQNHMFVIIEKNYAITIEYFALLISSKLEKLKYNQNKLLLKDEQNNLKRDSLVKTDIIYKITDEQILFKVGNVDKDKIEEYKKMI